MCWPISDFTIWTVVWPFGIIVNQMEGVKASAASVAARAPGIAPVVKPMPSASPDPVAIDRTMKSRRDSCVSVVLMSGLASGNLGGAFDGADDA